jgi:hypothetical protein
MNEQLDNTLVSPTAGSQGRPQFLKVICILSFISCGLWIVLFGIGSSCLSLTDEKVTEIWDKAMENPRNQEALKAIDDPVRFLHGVGMLCAYGALLNIAVLIGVIMMWRLNKIGFFIYVVAELASKFTGYMVDLGNISDNSGSGGLIFWIVLDLVFIGMYAANLKYMNKGNGQLA